MVIPLYLDTSALVKYYLTETGSHWLIAQLEAQPQPVVITSLLAHIESACTFARRQREGLLTADDRLRLLAALDYDLKYRYQVARVDRTVIDTARQLASRHPLRAYDAVHLATGWLANRRLVQAGRPALLFVTADDRLLAIAQAEGLLTENPNHHP